MTDLDRHAPLVTGLFPDLASAEQAYQELSARGYSNSDINVVMADETRKRYFPDGDSAGTGLGTKAAEGARIGAGIGGTLGAIVAAVAAVGTSLVLPGVGLVIAGPLAAALLGAGAGGAAGGLMGGLVGWGIPAKTVERYEQGIREGGILIAFRPRNEDDARYFSSRWRNTAEAAAPRGVAGRVEAPPVAGPSPAAMPAPAAAPSTVARPAAVAPISPAATPAPVERVAPVASAISAAPSATPAQVAARTPVAPRSPLPPATHAATSSPAATAPPLADSSPATTPSTVPRTSSTMTSVPASPPAAIGSMGVAPSVEIPAIGNQAKPATGQAGLDATAGLSGAGKPPAGEGATSRPQQESSAPRTAAQAAAESAYPAFTEQIFEVRQMAEKAVIGKTVRVVEEVIIGKTATVATRQVSGTVRKTVIETEQAGREPSATDFRGDFQARFAGSGRAYEDIAPAYRYGAALGSDPRHRGRTWDEIESGARSGWQARYPGSAWQDMKAAIRHGWDSVRGSR